MQVMVMAILTDLSANGPITDRLSLYVFYLVDTGQHAQLLTNFAIITYQSITLMSPAGNAASP